MRYIVGVNYWASNAGTEMWKHFDRECIKKDLTVLSDNGIRYIRVFPNWRDFQPVIPMYGQSGVLTEYRMADETFPNNPYYLDEEMMHRFGEFCDICDEMNIRIIPALITGWMSGRLFIPAALFGRNLITDTVALNFERLFIEGFVKRFKDRKAIVAWDVGNECCCLSDIDGKDSAEFWTAFISNTIRSVDDRMVISGVHDLKLEGKWTIKSQADSCDMLVAHPYPYWGNHTKNDKISSIRTLLHATVLNNLYKDIGQKPCFVNEIGTMGPMVCDDETATGFMRVNLFSCLAHGAEGVMWWCANDQTNLKTAPYTWNMCETELGLIDNSGNPKPVLKEIKKFSDWMQSKGLELSPKNTDGVCILTRGQEQWGIAYMTYVLCVMAGVNIKFCYADDELPDADIYLMPSVKGHWIMPGERYSQLKQRVREGAKLYISNSDAVLSEFGELAGVKIIDSDMTSEKSAMRLFNDDILFERYKKFYIDKNKADAVLAYEKSGEAVFTQNKYGKGTVFYLNFPLEEMLLNGTDKFNDNHYIIYRYLFKEKINEHCVSCNEPSIGITHHIDGADIYAVIINYSDKTHKLNLVINEEYMIKSVVKGDVDKIAPYSTVILKLCKI